MRERLKEAAREAILEAAEGVFAKEGVQTARMEAIAQAAGVAVGTLYNHFEDRSSLLEALLKARRHDLLGRVDEALDSSEARPFGEQLDAVIAAVQGHLEEHEGFMRVLVEAEYVHVVGKLQPAELMKQLRLRLGELVERGVKANVLRGDDAPFFDWFFVGALRGLMVRRMKGEATEPPEVQRATLVRFLLEGARS